MPPSSPTDFDDLPGAEVIRAGLEDLAAGRESIASRLVEIGAPRLNSLGIQLPTKPEPDADHQLYRLLVAQHGLEAHSQFNSWIRQLVSFERTLEHRRRR